LQAPAHGFDFGQLGHGVGVPSKSRHDTRGRSGGVAVGLDLSWAESQAFSSSLSAKLLVLMPPSEPLKPL